MIVSMSQLGEYPAYTRSSEELCMDGNEHYNFTKLKEGRTVFVL